MLLLTIFASFALTLTTIGLYGVIAYSVTQRTLEIGIRMAFGARQKNVLWPTMRETLLLVLVGIAVGVPAALGTSRLVGSLLFGLAPGDPATILLATLLMVAVASLTGFVPARRASQVDPMIALRYQ